MEAQQWFKTDSGGSDRLKRQPRGVTQLTSGCCVSIGSSLMGSWAEEGCV